MGIETDQEALLLVGTEHSEIFSQSLEEAKMLKVFTQKQALEFIGARIRVPPSRRSEHFSSPSAQSH